MTIVNGKDILPAPESSLSNNSNINNNINNRRRSTPAMNLYRPPAARNDVNPKFQPSQSTIKLPNDTSAKLNNPNELQSQQYNKKRTRRPDQQMYIPKGRRSEPVFRSVANVNNSPKRIDKSCFQTPTSIKNQFSSINEHLNNSAAFNTSESLNKIELVSSKNSSLNVINTVTNLKSNSKNTIISNFNRSCSSISSESSQELDIEIQDSNIQHQLEVLNVPPIECRKFDSSTSLEKIVLDSNEVNTELNSSAASDVDMVITRDNSSSIEFEKDKLTNSLQKNTNNIVNDEKVKTSGYKGKETHDDDDELSDEVVQSTYINYCDNKDNVLKSVSDFDNKLPVDIVLNKANNINIGCVNKENSNLNIDECDWETLFDDEGNCLENSILNELTENVGQVKITSTSSDYRSFQSIEERTNDGECIIEIYDFPAEFKTRDLLTSFAAFRNRAGFQIKWVDDTHALGIFNSPVVADEVLQSNLPFVKTRPIRLALPESKNKAKTIQISLPPAERPKTCSALAKRLVTGALGIRIPTDRKKREEEKLILKEARDQKRLAAKQREAAWEGTLESTNVASS